jgi:hypothetical protein
VAGLQAMPELLPPLLEPLPELVPLLPLPVLVLPPVPVLPVVGAPLLLPAVVVPPLLVPPVEAVAWPLLVPATVVDPVLLLVWPPELVADELDEANPEVELAELLVEEALVEVAPEEVDSTPPSDSSQLPAMQLSPSGQGTDPLQLFPTNETVGVNGKQPASSAAARPTHFRLLTARPPRRGRAFRPSRA